jgi:hypothetical protein
MQVRILTWSSLTLTKTSLNLCSVTSILILLKNSKTSVALTDLYPFLSITLYISSNYNSLLSFNLVITEFMYCIVLVVFGLISDAIFSLINC